jgi:hypothetical protein
VSSFPETGTDDAQIRRGNDDAQIREQTPIARDGRGGAIRNTHRTLGHRVSE